MVHPSIYSGVYAYAAWGEDRLGGYGDGERDRLRALSLQAQNYMSTVCSFRNFTFGRKRSKTNCKFDCPILTAIKDYFGSHKQRAEIK